ncbi:hypothetical protein PVK06_018916 [Gossypium arboreum]|uniref:Uncharacterized protein n=1 Tax=Gossypium arboreum TaxID=29729 RepID=A0ABR0PIB3_GOSAR|nr:hypothetical protein PVK06_018916 [Gossypium arboreum]
MATLLKKVGVRIQFDIGDLIFTKICKHAEKIVKATEKYEKIPLEMKFTHKWLEGTHASLNLWNVQEVGPTEEITLPKIVGTNTNTVHGCSNTSTIVD